MYTHTPTHAHTHIIYTLPDTCFYFQHLKNMILTEKGANIHMYMRIFYSFLSARDYTLNTLSLV